MVSFAHLKQLKLYGYLKVLK